MQPRQSVGSTLMPAGPRSKSLRALPAAGTGTPAACHVSFEVYRVLQLSRGLSLQ